MSPEAGPPRGIDRLLSGQARTSKKIPVRAGGGGPRSGGRWKIPRAAYAALLGGLGGTLLLVLIVLGARAFLSRRAAEPISGPPELLFRLDATCIRIRLDESKGEVRLERGEVSGEIPTATGEDLVALVDAVGGVPLALSGPVRLRIAGGPTVLLEPSSKVFDGDEIRAYLEAGPGTTPARLRAVLLGAGRRARESWAVPEDLEEAVVQAARTRGAAGGRIGEADARRAARILWALGDLRPTSLSVRW